MRVESKQLRNFLAIVEQGSFTRAAETVAMSQPALSASIAQLEHCLGVSVLNRSKTGATPTVFGEMLIRHARAVTSTLEHAGAEIALKRQGISGPLAIGGTPVSLNSLVPGALALITRNLGPVSAIVREVTDDMLHPLLRTDEIDLAVGVVGLDAPEADIVEEVLIEAIYEVVVSSDHPLAGRAHIDMAALAALPWVVPAKGGAFRRQIESLFAMTGIPFPTAAITCDSLSLLKEVVRQTNGVTVLPHPAIAAERKAGTLTIVPLDVPRAPRTFGIMRLRTRPTSPLADAMISALRSVAAEHGSAMAQAASGNAVRQSVERVPRDTLKR